MNADLEKLLFDELEQYCRCTEPSAVPPEPLQYHLCTGANSPLSEYVVCSTAKDGMGGFLPAFKQVANVAGLPGIVKVFGTARWLLLDIPESSACCYCQKSIAMPDVHSGYGFAIGNVAAFDMEDPEAVVSPGTALAAALRPSKAVRQAVSDGCAAGGVGFDINCGVRLLRTNLFEADVQPVKEELAQCLFDHIPVGVGSQGVIPMTMKVTHSGGSSGCSCWCRIRRRH